MGKTNQNTQNTNNAQTENNRKCKNEHQRFQGMKNAATKAGNGIKSAVGYGASLVVRSGGEVLLDVASAGAGVAAGAVCAKGAHDAVIVGSQMLCNEYNFATGKGTVSVKGKFGKWKEISTSEYLAAINRGKQFKEVIPNYFTNRHAEQINTTANVAGGVAGVGGVAIGFTGTRRLGKQVIPNLSKKEIIEQHEKQESHSMDGDLKGSTSDI